MDKKISIATVAKRMNRILAAYREQRAQEIQTDDGTPQPVASTSSSQSSSSSSSSTSSALGDKSCTVERKMVLDKSILNFAAQIDTIESDSDDDSSDHNSYTFAESPPKRRCTSKITATVTEPQSKRRRSQPSRTVKRAAVKLTSLASKRAHQKPTCTITSSSKASASPSPDKKRRHDQSSSSDSSSDLPMTLEFPGDSDDSDTVIKPKSKPPTKSSKPRKPIKSSIIIKAT